MAKMNGWKQDTHAAYQSGVSWEPTFNVLIATLNVRSREISFV